MPSVIEKGQSTNLSWNSTNATELRLEPGLGSVGPQGSSSVSPDRSTTYTLVATGPGGRAEDRSVLFADDGQNFPATLETLLPKNGT